MNYYNEIDAFKAEVLREAIKAGAIAPGDVDERSIANVQPDELVGYTQWHFFAGGGFWSLALRNAGWPDIRPVATLSCPCPSFSAAGKGAGFDDPRHLWPEAFRLIRECRFPVCFGEQVAAAIGHGWLDLVSGDLEEEGYAVAAAVLGAHSAGAPHIRQRLYFCAVSDSAGFVAGRDASTTMGHRGSVDTDCSAGDGGDTERGRIGGGDQRGFGAAWGEVGQPQNGPRAANESCDGCEDAGVSSDAERGRRGSGWREEPDTRFNSTERRARWDDPGSSSGFVMRGADASCEGYPQLARKRDEPTRSAESHGPLREWRGPGWLDPLTARSVAVAGATRGFWADCDWWYGRDGKFRPTGPGIQPLANGSPARVGRLRLYGDAICVPAATEFIESCAEVMQ